MYLHRTYTSVIGYYVSTRFYFVWWLIESNLLDRLHTIRYWIVNQTYPLTIFLNSLWIPIFCSTWMSSSLCRSFLVKWTGILLFSFHSFCCQGSIDFWENVVSTLKTSLIDDNNIHYVLMYHYSKLLDIIFIWK